MGDYIDRDQRLSLNGAEYFDYRQSNVEPPPDGLMVTPMEIKQVLGFSGLISQSQWEKLRPLLSMRQAVGYNTNTMRPELLAALLDLQPKVIQPLLITRRQNEISQVSQIENALGRFVQLDESELRNAPSRFIRITSWNKRRGQRFVTGVELTPFLDDAPWRRHYYYSEQNNENDTGPYPKPATALLQ